MHALCRTTCQPDHRRRGYAVLAPQLDQRRVVIRLRDGETILVGGAPTYERALVLAQKTITELDGARGRVADAGRSLHQPGRDRLGRRPPLVIVAELARRSHNSVCARPVLITGPACRLPGHGRASSCEVRPTRLVAPGLFRAPLRTRRRGLDRRAPTTSTARRAAMRAATRRRTRRFWPRPRLPSNSTTTSPC